MKKPKVRRTEHLPDPPVLTEPHSPGPWVWGIPAPGPYPQKHGPQEDLQGGYPEPKAAPRAPPNLGKVPVIQAADGLTVACFFGPAGIANAELIVTAVNAWLAQKGAEDSVGRHRPEGRSGAGFGRPFTSMRRLT